MNVPHLLVVLGGF